MRQEYQLVPSMPNLGVRMSQVKGPEGQMWDTSEEGVKSRMQQRLKTLGWTLKDLAKEAEEDYKNVQRWVNGTTTTPAAFIARYAAVVPVNAEWLLTGRGDEYAPSRPRDAERVLRGIGALLDAYRSGLLTSPPEGASTGGVYASLDFLDSLDRERTQPPESGAPPQEARG